MAVGHAKVGRDATKVFLVLALCLLDWTKTSVADAIDIDPKAQLVLAVYDTGQQTVTEPSTHTNAIRFLLYSDGTVLSQDYADRHEGLLPVPEFKISRISADDSEVLRSVAASSLQNLQEKYDGGCFPLGGENEVECYYDRLYTTIAVRSGDGMRFKSVTVYGVLDSKEFPILRQIAPKAFYDINDRIENLDPGHWEAWQPREVILGFYHKYPSPGDLPAIPSPESWPKVNDAALNICVPTPSTVRPSNWRLIVDIFRRGISVGKTRWGLGHYDVVIPDLESLPDFGRFLRERLACVR